MKITKHGVASCVALSIKKFRPSLKSEKKRLPSLGSFTKGSRYWAVANGLPEEYGGVAKPDPFFDIVTCMELARAGGGAVPTP
ncbi:MAG: hypothetical protein AB9Q18_09250 [Candidatus Reddybacter sp.]